MILSFEGYTPHIDAEAFVAPTAVVIGNAALGPGSSVWFGAVVRADSDAVTIGAGTNLQDLVVVHVDPGFPVAVGEQVTVGHHTILHGCRVDDGSLVGMGCVLMNGSKVGKEALLGAGSLLPEGHEVPDGMLAFGRPAKVIRPLSPAERQKLTRSAEHYTERANVYRLGD